jgi:hypothetical protein
MVRVTNLGSENSPNHNIIARDKVLSSLLISSINGINKNQQNQAFSQAIGETRK